MYDIRIINYIGTKVTLVCSKWQAADAPGWYEMSNNEADNQTSYSPPGNNGAYWNRMCTNIPINIEKLEILSRFDLPRRNWIGITVNGIRMAHVVCVDTLQKRKNGILYTVWLLETHSKQSDI